jgi:hypothetical protein
LLPKNIKQTTAYVLKHLVIFTNKLIITIMAKGQDAKKNVKKEPTKTAKEKKAAKREKKGK